MPEHNYKVIISGGGTGGHIYPAIAIAKAILELAPEAEILFVGAKNRMEMQKVPAAGFKIEGLWISGIQRKFTIDNLLFPVKVLSSYIMARNILKRFQPDIAIGVGGYASFPLLYAASDLAIPTVIQEQNGYAGVANKFLAKNAETICVAYDGMEKFFPKGKIRLTGNPVRKDILDIRSKKEQAFAHFNLSSEKRTILVVGGSLGARTINESIEAGLEQIDQAGIQLIWQTGKSYYEKVKDVGSRYAYVRVFDFIYEMDLAYVAADIVISRAGALSISELALVGKPAILVPSPNVAEDHQTKNAIALLEREAAILVEDAEARDCLVMKALKLLNDPVKRDQLSEHIKTLGRPDAANTIAKEVIRIIDAKSPNRSFFVKKKEEKLL